MNAGEALRTGPYTWYCSCAYYNNRRVGCGGFLPHSLCLALRDGPVLLKQSCHLCLPLPSLGKDVHQWHKAQVLVCTKNPVLHKVLSVWWFSADCAPYLMGTLWQMCPQSVPSPKKSKRLILFIWLIPTKYQTIRRLQMSFYSQIIPWYILARNAWPCVVFWKEPPVRWTPAPHSCLWTLRKGHPC